MQILKTTDFGKKLHILAKTTDFSKNWIVVKLWILVKTADFSILV